MRYLTDNAIEGRASRILMKYLDLTNMADIPIPVPIEAILEELHGIFPMPKNLNEDGAADRILGRTAIMGDESIIMEIDSSIYPDEVPDQPPWTMARYRFTLAHELAHIELHVPAALAELRQGNLFAQPSGGTAPLVSLFRSSDEKMATERRDRKEIQADKMASALLMPHTHVLCQWREIHRGGDAGCENVYEEMRELQRTEPNREFHYPKCVLTMAERFGVSKTAMMYRLKDMRRIDFSEPLPTFF